MRPKHGEVCQVMANGHVPRPDSKTSLESNEEGVILTGTWDDVRRLFVVDYRWGVLELREDEVRQWQPIPGCRSNEQRLIELMEQMVDLSTTLQVPLIGFRCRFCWQAAKTPPTIKHADGCLVLKGQELLKEIRGY